MEKMHAPQAVQSDVKDLFANRASRVDNGSDIGRKGEEYAYIDLSNKRNSMFQSGNPIIGQGRLSSVEWVNGDGESRLPYDLKVYLTGKFLSIDQPIILC